MKIFLKYEEKIKKDIKKFLFIHSFSPIIKRFFGKKIPHAKFLRALN